MVVRSWNRQKCFTNWAQHVSGLARPWNLSFWKNLTRKRLRFTISDMNTMSYARRSYQATEITMSTWSLKTVKNWWFTICYDDFSLASSKIIFCAQPYIVNMTFSIWTSLSKIEFRTFSLIPRLTILFLSFILVYWLYLSSTPLSNQKIWRSKPTYV